MLGTWSCDRLLGGFYYRQKQRRHRVIRQHLDVPGQRLILYSYSHLRGRGEIAATEFAPSYRRATVMQATFAAVGLPSSIATWLAGASILWVVAGVLLGSVIPFTLIVILPTQ